jgi:hypothetical protein
MGSKMGSKRSNGIKSSKRNKSSDGNLVPMATMFQWQQCSNGNNVPMATMFQWQQSSGGNKSLTTKVPMANNKFQCQAKHLSRFWLICNMGLFSSFSFN